MMSSTTPANSDSQSVYIETYGCQMNVSDTEIVQSVLSEHGYRSSDSVDGADVVFLNTCSIRENAEQRIRKRLANIEHQKRKRPELVVGILGCMAERLRRTLFKEESIVDIICGPDQYRALPDLITEARYGEKGLAVRLSRVETYDDITPVRKDGISAWLSVMRGCDKFCTFCVVPFTRGRERSRSLPSIVDEVAKLSDEGFREVNLLGQNVNSYRWEGRDFADLLAAVAQADPAMRIRYTTSHPQDMSDKLIETMAAFDNICNYIHLPVQSGSDRVLDLMNRTYTISHYMERIRTIRELIPNAALSNDIIAGFPTEREEDHRRTLDVMREVGYDGAFMFKYSPRERTKAWAMGDDVPEEVKSRRLQEIIEVQNGISDRKYKALVGTTVEVLVEGPSKRDEREWKGRTRENHTVVFPRTTEVVGDTTHVHIEDSTSATLLGRSESDSRSRRPLELDVLTTA